MRIGLSELIIIFIIIIALIKPDKLNEYAKMAGAVMRKFMDETKGVNETINEMKDTVMNTVEPITSIEQDIQTEIKKNNI